MRLTPAQGVRVRVSEWPTPLQPLRRLDVLTKDPQRTHVPPAPAADEVLFVTNDSAAAQRMAEGLGSADALERVDDVMGLLAHMQLGAVASTIVFDCRAGSISVSSVLGWIASSQHIVVVFWGAPEGFAGSGRVGAIEWVVCEKEAPVEDVALLVQSLRTRDGKPPDEVDPSEDP